MGKSIIVGENDKPSVYAREPFLCADCVCAKGVIGDM